MNVFRRNTAQVGLVDAHTVVHIARHSRGSNMIGNGKGRICRKFLCVCRFPRKCMLRSAAAAPGICPFYGADDLEETRASANAVCFKGRRDSETDGLARAALIRNDKMRGQWIQSAFHAFNRGIECLEINGNVCTLTHSYPSLKRL